MFFGHFIDLKKLNPKTKSQMEALALYKQNKQCAIYVTQSAMNDFFCEHVEKKVRKCEIHKIANILSQIHQRKSLFNVWTIK